MSTNPLNGVKSLETIMAAAVHDAQEKPKAKERRLTNKNIKRVYEELDDVDELLQDVLNICSSATNRYTLSCKHFLPRPRASDSAVDKRHDVAQGQRNLVFDKLRLNAPSPYALLILAVGLYAVFTSYTKRGPLCYI